MLKAALSLPDSHPPSAALAPTEFSAKRLLPLDGLRGVAILLILVHHYFPSRELPTIIGRWTGRFVISSWFGVDLFFVLSGFLITGILFDAKSDRNYFKNFYARRTLRVFPLYYGVLIVTLILLPLICRLPFHWDLQPWLWLYGTNLYPLIKHSVSFQFPSPLHLEYGHFWSLAVEEHFYLVWPMVVFLFPRRVLMWISCGVVVAAPLLRAYVRYHFLKTNFYPDIVYQTTFLRMDGLVIGGWVALAVRGPGGPRRFLTPACWVVGVCGSLLTGMFFRDGGLYRGAWDVEVVGYSLFAILFAALIFPIVCPPANLLQKVLAAGWLRFFGRYSYGLYVFHELLRPLFFPNGDPSGLSVANLVRITIALAMSIGIAIASFHLYEKRFLGLKRFFESRHVHQKPD